MESENSMQRNIKKEEGEGFRDILNEAVNQGQRLDDEQFKTHILKTTEVKLEQKFPGCEVKLEQKFPGCAIKVKPPICDEEDMPSEFEEKLPPPDKPRIIVDNPDQSTKLVESQEVGPSTAAASSKSRPLPCLCAGRDCWGTFCKCFTYGFYCGQDCQCGDGCLNTHKVQEEFHFDRGLVIKWSNYRGSLCRCSNKTHCSNNYCGCFKLNQRCLIGCKCVGCTNPYGEK